MAPKQPSDNGSYRWFMRARMRRHLPKAAMGQSAPRSAVPDDDDWDIAFTRLSRQVAPEVDACVRGLSRRFGAVGLHCDVQSRPTPRGLSTFLSVIGQHGLVCIVDITLIEGMVVAARPGAALDLRLLDACGDVVAHCASATASQATVYRTCADEVVAAASVERSATSVFVMAMGHFGMARASQARAAPRRPAAPPSPGQ